MKQIIIYISLLIASFESALAQSNQQHFQMGIENYQKGEYQKAIEHYNAILKSGEESSSLYYNLASTHYKLNHISESIYYYEKALKINPENQEAKNGLLFANQMKVDAITPLPKTWLRQLSDTIIGIFSLHTWAILSIIGILLFVTFFLCYYFLEKTAHKRLFFTLLLASALFAIGTYFIANFRSQQIADEKYAILFDKTVRVFSEANAYSSEVTQLHEGTKVEITQKKEQWVKIKIANGKTGWIKESSLKKI